MPALPANVAGRCTSTTKFLVFWGRILDGDDGGDAEELVEVVPSEGLGQRVSCVSRGRGALGKQTQGTSPSWTDLPFQFCFAGLLNNYTPAS